LLSGIYGMGQDKDRNALNERRIALEEQNAARRIAEDQASREATGQAFTIGSNAIDAINAAIASGVDPSTISTGREFMAGGAGPLGNDAFNRTIASAFGRDGGQGGLDLSRLVGLPQDVAESQLGTTKAQQEILAHRQPEFQDAYNASTINKVIRAGTIPHTDASLPYPPIEAATSRAPYTSDITTTDPTTGFPVTLEQRTPGGISFSQDELNAVRAARTYDQSSGQPQGQGQFNPPALESSRVEDIIRNFQRNSGSSSPQSSGPVINTEALRRDFGIGNIESLIQYLLRAPSNFRIPGLSPN
jgi:hypothetical protein